MNKSILSIICLLLIVTSLSGCTSDNKDDKDSQSDKVTSNLEENIKILNLTVTPSIIGNGSEVNFVINYTGNRSITPNLLIEAYPIYGTTIGDPDYFRREIISLGDNLYKIEFSNVGGKQNRSDSELTGIKFKIGVFYTDNNIPHDESFYTQIYPVK